MTTCGIYGFEFTKPFRAAGLSFTPLYGDRDQAHALACDQGTHHLTGTVSGDRLNEDQVTYRLEAVLSFIERQDVRLGEPTNEPTAVDDPLSQFGKVLPYGPRPWGGGCAINPDRVPGHQHAREVFIEKALARLSDDKFCEDTKFRLLFIKAAESCRQRTAFFEVSYFLLFSGLEAYCRKVQGDFGPNAAAPIARTLQDFGFRIAADDIKNAARAVSTYREIRNVMFHNGELRGTVKLTNVTVDAETYFFHLHTLVFLTVMKIVGFEDAERDWDGWIDFARPHGNFGQGDFGEVLEAMHEAEDQARD